MTNYVTVNGITYNDGAYNITTNVYGLANGGNVPNWVPLISNTMIEINTRIAAIGASLRATSSTTESISAGTKNLVIQTSKGFATDDFITAVDLDDPLNNWMFGQVVSYNSGTGAIQFTVTSPYFLGSGSHDNWSVAISAQPGQQGIPGPAPADASETVKGILELATQAEVDAGTDDARAVTPLKLPLRVNRTVQTGNFNATANCIYLVDTTAGAITATHDASPNVGDIVGFVDVGLSWEDEPLTQARNGNKINGNTSDFVNNVAGLPSTWEYTGATFGWRLC
jgi:hypothetical protein